MLRAIRGLRLDVIELDVIGEPRNGPVQQELQKRSGILSVPQVFKSDGTFVGADDKIQELARSGALAAALS